jgi:hypothetical protein
MKTSRTKLAPATRRLVTEVYGRLDYGWDRPTVAKAAMSSGERSEALHLSGGLVAVRLRRKLRRRPQFYVGAGGGTSALIMKRAGPTVEPYNSESEVAPSTVPAPPSRSMQSMANTKGRFDHL